MADTQYKPLGTESTPADWVVPGALDLLLKSIYAEYDGTSAASSFVPTVELIDDAGRTVGAWPYSSSVAAGGSADVTWFPGVVNLTSTTTVATLATVALFQTGQSIPSGAYTTIAFDTILSEHDPDGVFSVNLTTGVVTTTVSGVFHVDKFLGFAAAHSGNLRLLLNGTAGSFGKSEDSFAANSDLGSAGGLNSNAGQTFESLIYQDSGGSLPIYRARTTVTMLAPT